MAWMFLLVAVFLKLSGPSREALGALHAWNTDRGHDPCVALGEPLTLARLLAAALIVVGLTIIKLRTSA